MFRDLAYVFAAAVLGGLLARLLHQPTLLGYVAGGIAVSPFTPGLAISDVHTFEVFAEIGVILLVYSIGIEFSLRDLAPVKWVAILGGAAGVLLAIALGIATGALLGWPVVRGAVIGMIVAPASTMVLARSLMDRGELHAEHGRVMIGLSLVDDLAVVVMTIVLPTLGAWDPARLVALVVALGKAALVLVPFAYLAARVVPPMLERVAAMQHDEIFVLLALALGLGTAALSQAVGLSLALGAFLAGLLVSNSAHAHETLTRLLPLRNAFVAVFFVTIGALVDPRRVAGNVGLLAVIVGLVVVGKLVIWFAVVRVFGYPSRTALLVAVGLTQIGEFSFILVEAARTVGHVDDDVYTTALAAALITILINAVLVRAVSGRVTGRAITRPRPTR